MRYVGYVAPASNPAAKTQIGVWSAVLATYGDLGLVDNFLEEFQQPALCATNGNMPQGRFPTPYYLIGSSDYLPSSFSGSDSGDAVECGRSWVESFLTARINSV